MAKCVSPVQAPMAECWDQMSAGMKVEVACGEEGVTKDAFWVATVIAIAGKTKEWNYVYIHYHGMMLRGMGCDYTRAVQRSSNLWVGKIELHTLWCETLTIPIESFFSLDCTHYSQKSLCLCWYFDIHFQLSQ